MIEVMVENVPSWVRSKAIEVADTYQLGYIPDYENYTLTEIVEQCLDEFGSDRETALALIAHYGWSDALVGGVDYEDSPIEQFTTDVYKLAESYLYNRGYYIDYLEGRA